MGEELIDVLARAEKRLENDKPVKRADMETLDRGYGNALNKSDCPCGSGMPFEFCCKLRWNVVQRGDKKAREQQQQQQQSEPQVPEDDQQPGEQIENVLQIQLSNTRGPLMSLSKEWRNRHPGEIMKILLMVYNSLVVHMLDQAAGIGMQAMDALKQRGPASVPHRRR